MNRVFFYLIGLLILTSCDQNKKDQVTVQDYERAAKFMSNKTRDLVLNQVSQVSWNDNDEFIYRISIDRGYKYLKSDRSNITDAFDHEKLAKILSSELGEDIDPKKLGIFNVRLMKNTLSFSLKDTEYTLNLDNYSLKKEVSKFKMNPRNYVVSPNGKLAAFRKNNNLYVLDLSSGKEIQLTKDGKEDYGYATNDAGWTRGDSPVLLWSPQSDKIATFIHDSRRVTSMMHLTPTAVGPQKVKSFKYPLPGDEHVFSIERVVIHIKNKKVVKLNMPPDAHRSTTTDHIAGRGGLFLDVEWSKDGNLLAFVSSSRDHKTATLRVADPYNGRVQTLHSETEDTFYESGFRSSNWRIIPEHNEAIWFSAKDNWGHLYLHDLKTGQEKSQITKGEWVVLQVVHVDVEQRQIYFYGGGKEDGDPYYWYFYRIDMDGNNLVNLTPENAHHTVELSPSKKYFVDTYSTPQTPPITVLRDMTGKVIQEVSSANVDALIAMGWKPPENFIVKARDGETDIYGLLYKPSNFDPSKKYPILNYLYPGPQTGSVGSRAFQATRSIKQSTAELGFIVVEMDAMGTPGRSKSFHEAYYGNMGDNGLPDQKAGIEQLAAKYPWMDIERIGIWGHSGGGFASTAAIFQYPGFYDVAVSSSGNHDNRNYEDDWGEKWHGLLEKGESGGDNYDKQANQYGAKNLVGKLMLAHGLMDDNVPPSNTLLVVNALIKANKDFDLVVFPNARHGYGADSNYFTRRRWDYFVKHLKGVEPPKEFELK